MRLQSKAYFKAWIARYAKVDTTLLPYNQKVVNYIKKFKNEFPNSKIILATASYKNTALEVGEYLKTKNINFDEIFYSDENLNFSGKNKAKFLKDKFKNFIYIGNSKDDLAVWKEANKAIIVSNKKSLINKCQKVQKNMEIIPILNSNFKSLIKLIRPHQWVKNILVFLPIFTSLTYFSLKSWILGLLAFISFSILASMNYIINDAFDIEADRKHPSKRFRPLARGGGRA